MQIAIYARVSTRRQDTKSQEPDLEQWVKAYANGTPVVWFKDKWTGKTMDRPGWKRLEAELRAGKIATLVCWRLDRLGRTASGLTALFDELIARKVNLVSLKDGIDLSTPAGRLIANVLASVASYETEIRAERILAGQAVARANGKRWGGSVKGRRIRVKPDQERIIRTMRAAGEKIAAIARATGLSRPTVYDVLRNGHAASNGHANSVAR
jgi:DNA invertase Pin-like site-specific DNA recombinase